VETLAHPLALLIVVAAPIALLGAVAGAWQWGQWLVRAGGVLGVVGVVVTGVAVANLGVARTCQTDAAGKRVNRPIISVATGEGDCFRRAMGQLELAALAGVGASSVVLLRQARRGGADAEPGAPTR
jgi:hypothetical protein